MSINADSEYSALEPAPVEQSKGLSVVTTLAIAGLVGLLCLIIGAGAVLSDQEEKYNPSLAYVSPDKFILSATFKAPYFEESFGIPITAYVDHVAGNARVEYYSGANTWIYSKAEETSDFTLQPTYDQIKCFFTHHVEASPLPRLFPRLQYREGESDEDDSDHGPRFSAPSGPVLSLYTRQSGTKKVNDVDCHVWKYDNVQYREGKDYESLQPDAFGHAGNYTFYVNAKTGIPVRFHQLGHNVFNSGSHTEEYIIDYHSVTEVDVLPSHLFAPPSGMPCVADYTEEEGHFQRRRSPVQLMTGSLSHSSPKERVELADDLFDQWSKQHQKLYTTAAEHKLRKDNFFSTKKMIDSHNDKADKTYTMELNSFSDLSFNELKLLSGRKHTPVNTFLTRDVEDVCTQYVPLEVELPKSFSWTEDKKVGPYFDYDVTHRIHSQIACGSCWASAAICALTAQNIIVNGQDATEEELKDLYDGASVQHMLDCTNGDEYDVHACNGGIDSWGYSWMISKNSGLIASDNSYGHFLNANGFCHYAINDPSIKNVNPWTSKDVEKYATLKSCEHVGNKWNGGVFEDDKLVADLKSALFTHGPVSISIAVPMSLYYYKEGLYNDPECLNGLDDLSHSIVAVGWGVDEKTGEEYIIGANSWSSMWGQKGLVHFKAKGNICGFATVPVIPHVQKA